jgi:predicted DNA-binding transcriptional regulator YafY
MDKVERLFWILNLLKSRGALTVADLADECEVSEGTIQGDIQTLSEAKVSISNDHGYSLLSDEALLPVLNLTVDEFLSLHIGRQRLSP